MHSTAVIGRARLLVVLGCHYQSKVKQRQVTHNPNDKREMSVARHALASPRLQLQYAKGHILCLTPPFPAG